MTHPTTRSILIGLLAALPALAADDPPEKLPRPGRFNRTSKAVTGALVLGGLALLRNGDIDAIESSGDRTQLAAPIAALTMSLAKDDPLGTQQYLTGAAATSRWGAPFMVLAGYTD